MVEKSFCARVVTRRRDLVVIEAAGELDLQSAADLRDCLREAAEQESEHLIVDLTGIEFMDSAGLSVLVVVARHSLLKQYELALVSPAGPVRRLMHIAGLDAVVPLYETREQALLLGAAS